MLKNPQIRPFNIKGEQRFYIMLYTIKSREKKIIKMYLSFLVIDKCSECNPIPIAEQLH